MLAATPGRAWRRTSCRWDQSTSYPVTLLSDFYPHGEMTRAYGLFNEEIGASLRAVVIVDKGGVVRFACTYQSVRLPGPTGQGLTDSDLDVAEVLAEVDRINISFTTEGWGDGWAIMGADCS